MTSTIFAQISNVGKSAISVFRISGKKSFLALKKLGVKKKINHAKFFLSNIYCPSSKDLIDKAMIVGFKAPNSFTSEDVVEIHTHGGIAISNFVTEILLNIPGIKHAENGEFSKRAFLNQKIDLTQAEAICDLINSQTRMQHKQAIRQLKGDLGNLYKKWRKSFVKIISVLETNIDFPDEIIPQNTLNEVQKEIDIIKKQMLDHLNDKNHGEKLRNGITIGIFGKPNVGKSSLINIISKRNIAIVTDTSGTTRDIIETHLDIGGYPIILSDTAGIRNDASNEIEKIGIKKSLELKQSCDIEILTYSIQDIEKSITDNTKSKDTILVINKVDLISEAKLKNYKSKKKFKDAIFISCHQKKGIKSLTDEIIKKISGKAFASNNPIITRNRHRKSIKESLIHLKKSQKEQDIVIVAEEIRQAMRNIEIIIGNVSSEEILGEIFSSFCIGK